MFDEFLTTRVDRFAIMILRKYDTAILKPTLVHRNEDLAVNRK